MAATQRHLRHRSRPSTSRPPRRPPSLNTPIPLHLRDLQSDFDTLLGQSTAASTRAGLHSAWQLWVEFTSTRGIDVQLANTATPLRNLYFAGFKIALLTGKVGCKRYARGTAGNYVSHVKKHLSSRAPNAVAKSIDRAIKRVYPAKVRQVHDITLDQLTKVVMNARASSSPTRVRNSLAYLYLVLSVSCSESATVKV